MSSHRLALPESWLAVVDEQGRIGWASAGAPAGATRGKHLAAVLESVDPELAGALDLSGPPAHTLGRQLGAQLGPVDETGARAVAIGPTPAHVGGLSLLGRLAHGIEHRVNNLITVLHIAHHQLADDVAPGPDSDQDLRDILARTAEHLELLQHIISRGQGAATLATQLQALASFTSGLDHRIAIELGPCEDFGGGPTGAELVPVLLAASLTLHHAGELGGRLRYAATGSAAAPVIEFTLIASRAELDAAFFDGPARADLAMTQQLARACGATVEASASRSELTLRIALPGATAQPG